MSPRPSTVSAPDGALPRRILIVRLSAHGDVIHTLPLLAAIKRKDPTVQVGWLVETSAAPLLADHPWIDHLHVIDRKRWLRLLKNPLQWPTVLRECLGQVAQLRAEGYEASLDAQGLLKSAIWPWLAGIPRRYGFRKAREWAELFYNRCLAPISIRSRERKAADQFLELARAIGCDVSAPELITPPASEAACQRLTFLLPASERPLIVLAPFTRWASKHWPAESWTRLIERLAKEPVQLALLGAESDLPAAEAILSDLSGGHGVVNLVGKTNWPDLYALFDRAAVVIGLDSAPLHIADAVGKPWLIGLYGPTAPERTGPIGQRQTVLSTQLACQPCFERDCPIKTHDCMRQVTPDQVLAAVRTALEVPA